MGPGRNGQSVAPESAGPPDELPPGTQDTMRGGCEVQVTVSPAHWPADTICVRQLQAWQLPKGTQVALISAPASETMNRHQS